MKLTTALALAAALGAAGCGSDDAFPPAAEPAISPPVTATPEGRIIDLPGEAEGLAADPETGLVAVGLRNPDQLVLVDGATGKTERLVPLSESPRHLQLAEPGGPVLVPAERSNALIEVDLPSGKVVTSTPVGAFPHDAAALGARRFVGAEMGDTLSVVSDGRVEDVLPAPQQPGGVAVAGFRVGVVAVAERVLEVIDGNTLEGLGRVDAGVGPTHVVAGPDGRFYVVDTEGDAVLMVRTAPRVQVVDRVNLPGTPYGVAVDPRRNRLWVTLTETNEVMEYRLTGRTPRLLRSHPTVRQPNTVAVDWVAGRLYLAGRVDGELQIIDLDR